MAQWHLETALQARQWLHEVAPEEAKALDERLGLSAERLDHWRSVVENLIILHDPDTGLMEEFEGFFDLDEVDWSQYVDRTQSMQFLLGIEGANAHQVIKQADVILLLCLLRDEYDQKTWQVNWDYYVPRTDIVTDRRLARRRTPGLPAKWAARTKHTSASCKPPVRTSGTFGVTQVTACTRPRRAGCGRHWPSGLQGCV
jgi:trehalose/maltose hydrolase-like predicted phosphorylase